MVFQAQTHVSGQTSPEEELYRVLKDPSKYPKGKTSDEVWEMLSSVIETIKKPFDEMVGDFGSVFLDIPETKGKTYYLPYEPVHSEGIPDKFDSIRLLTQPNGHYIAVGGDFDDLNDEFIRQHAASKLMDTREPVLNESLAQNWTISAEVIEELLTEIKKTANSVDRRKAVDTALSELKSGSVALAIKDRNLMP